MLTYRTFRNTDPPVLTEIWRSRVGQYGLMSPVSPDLFEQLVFAKLYFDYDGLIVARDGDRAVGFAHAGFGPNEARNAISTELGVTCILVVRPDCEEAEVAAGLLRQCEQYMLRSGARVLYGGGIRPLNPFYQGLYGGSELPGVLHGDRVAWELFDCHGYREIDRTLVLRRELDDFQAVIDRQQMQIRRGMVVEVTEDPPTQDWWEACTIGEFELTQFELIPRDGGPAVARAKFRSLEPGGTVGAIRTTGLMELSVAPTHRRRGLAVFLLSEAFRQFVRQDIMLVEAQVMQQNTAALGMYHKLGFRQVGQGSVFRKESTR
ncbi:MAG: GNAT family N-acetyltransferase [Pirellulales bacterium]|nr:GNAT family N-acetyltransferase [Pirellulales bacterium]